jgi:amino acid transporter
MDAPKPGDLRRVIGFWGGTALIIGLVIGSGIFRKPYSLANDVGHPGVILGLWVVFGFVSLFGALALAELSSMLPRTGGAYVFLHAGYGPSFAFVFGWLYLLVTAPAGIGALATFFVELLLGLFGAAPRDAPGWFMPFVASSLVVWLSLVNLLGAAAGSAVQGAFTVVKVAALVAVIGASFAFAPGSFGHLAMREPAPVTFAALGAGAASVIWAYDGWIAVSMVAGEVVAAERIMKRIVVMGMLAIVLLYVGANVAYFYAMPVAAMRAEPGGVPQKIMGDLLGRPGAVAISAGIMCSVFGAMGANILAKPRVAYAMARDQLTFGFLGEAHPRWATPWAAILVQAAVAVALVLWLRDFDALTTYFVVVEWFALLFAVGAVFVLRRTMPEAPRPFRTPGYPWVPLLFLAGAVAGLTAILWGELSKPKPNVAPLIGLGIALAGFPVYLLWKGSRSQTAPSA